MPCVGVYLLLAMLSLCACANGSQTPDGTPSPRVGRTDDGPAAAPKEPSLDVLKAICASEFGQGDFARVDVFRDASGAVALLALRPDIERLTHAPHTYYGPDGASLLVVPDRPVTSEERKTDPVLKEQDELLRGLSESRSVSCSRHR